LIFEKKNLLVISLVWKHVSQLKSLIQSNITFENVLFFLLLKVMTFVNTYDKTKVALNHRIFLKKKPITEINWMYNNCLMFSTKIYIM